MTLFVWGVIFLLILVNALYVAAEFASVSVRRSRIRNLAEEGSSLVARLLPVLEDFTSWTAILRLLKSASRCPA